MNLICAFAFPVILSCIILVFLTIGHFIIKTEKNESLSFLIKVLTGAIITVTIVALFLTTFKSIFVLILPIVFAFKIKDIRNINPSRIPFPKITIHDAFFWVFAPITLITLSQYYLTGFFNSSYHFFIEVDSSFHIFVAQSVFDSGIESPTALLNNALSTSKISNPAPYHYFDIYLIGLLQNALTPLTGIAIFNYIITLFFIFIAYLSILAVINEFRQLTKTDYLIAILLLFLIGYTPVDALGIGHFQYTSQTLWGRCRSSLSFVLFAFLSIFHKRGDYNNFFFTLSIFPILNHYYSIFSIFIISSHIVNKWLFRKKTTKEYWLSCLKTIISIIAVFIFYSLWPQFETHSSFPKEVFSIPYIMHSFKLLAANTAVKMLYFIPFYFLLGFHLWKNRTNTHHLSMFSFLALLIVASMLLQSFGHIYFESFQFETYTFLPILSIAFALMIATSKLQPTRAKLFTLLVIGCILLPGIVYHALNKNISAIPNSNIKKIETRKLPSIIGYISNPANVYATYNPSFVHNASIIRAINNNSWAYGLNFRTDHQQNELRENNEQSYFNKYLKHSKIDTRYYTFEHQIQFLKSKNIEFCIIEIGAMKSQQKNEFIETTWPITKEIILAKIK